MNELGTAIALQLQNLADCVCQLLAEKGAGETCWCGVYPGNEVAWDFCGECSGDTCGMGYVHVYSMFPSERFPSEAIGGNACAAPLAVEVRVGALRCLPVADEQGSLPDEGLLLEASLAAVADASAMYEAMCSCIPAGSIGAYLPMGPRGGCVGGEWQFWVPL